MFFSVIIPTYNRPDRIFNAVKSVLNQSFLDFEIVIVNDGSSIEYVEFEEFLKNEPKINYIKQSNTYLASARNTGMKHAKGDFICFLDDDDVYLPNHLIALNDLIVSHNMLDALYHTRTIIRYFDNQEVKVDETKKHYDSNIDKILSDRFPTNAACISSKIAKEYKFNEDLKYSEDLDFWIQISQKYPIIKSNQYTTLLREEELAKMSDIKLPNQENYYNSYLYIKNKYKGYIPQKYLNPKLFELSVRCSELYKLNKCNKKSLSFLIKAISYKFDFILTRHFWSILIKR
jgi:glycosyltransferase involved in cell wall biosynthesis